MAVNMSAYILRYMVHLTHFVEPDGRTSSE